jgi:hypothetical protein
METIRSEIFRRILKEERSRLNSMFIMSRQMNMKLEPELFLSKVSSIIDPVMIKLADRDFGILKNVAVSLYEKVLELCVKDILGSEGKYPGFKKNLLTLIDNFSELTVNDTAEFISSVSNAILNILKYNPDIIDEWTGKIIKLKNIIKTIVDFKNFGFITAWTKGISCYRERSIELLQSIDDEAICMLLELPFQLNNKRDMFFNAIKSNPWLDPRKAFSSEKESLMVRAVGNFSGYDGVFSQPPVTFVSDGRIIACDDERFFILFADYYGIMLVSAGDQDIGCETKSDKSEINIDNDWNVVVRKTKLEIPKEYRVPIAGKSSIAGTLCYTSEMSHNLFVTGIGAGEDEH